MGPVAAGPCMACATLTSPNKPPTAATGINHFKNFMLLSSKTEKPRRVFNAPVGEPNLTVHHHLHAGRHLAHDNRLGNTPASLIEVAPIEANVSRDALLV